MGFFDGITSLISDVVTPTNIIGALGVYSAIKSTQQKENQVKQEFQQAQDLKAMDFENQIKLLQLKAALDKGGGGGGGGGANNAAAFAQIASEERKTKYLGIQDAMKNRAERALESSSNIIAAIKNLSEAAQRPLVR